MKRKPGHVILAMVSFTVNNKTSYNDKLYTYLCNGIEVNIGDIVIVNTRYGPSLAMVQRVQQEPVGNINVDHCSILSKVYISSLTSEAAYYNQKAVTAARQEEEEAKKKESEYRRLELIKQIGFLRDEAHRLEKELKCYPNR